MAAHAAVRDMLRAEGLEERLGYFGRRISVADVVEEFQGNKREPGKSFPPAQKHPRLTGIKLALGRFDSVMAIVQEKQRTKRK